MEPIPKNHQRSLLFQAEEDVKNALISVHLRQIIEMPIAIRNARLIMCKRKWKPIINFISLKSMSKRMEEQNNRKGKYMFPRYNNVSIKNLNVKYRF